MHSVVYSQWHIFIVMYVSHPSPSPDLVLFEAPTSPCFLGLEFPCISHRSHIWQQEDEGEGVGASRQGFSQAQRLVSHTRAPQPINRKCYSQCLVPEAVWDVGVAVEVGGAGRTSSRCESGAAHSQDTWARWLPFLPSIPGPLRV